MSYVESPIKPDLKTRAAVQIAAGRVQFAVRGPDGQVRYVRFEAKRKNEGPGKRYEKATLADATHVFISEKGYGTPNLGTYYPKNGRLYPKVADEHPHYAAMRIAIEFVNGEKHPEWDVQSESACGLCGMKLTDPVSIERGIGPECANKPTGSKILHASAFGQQELPGPEADEGSVSDGGSIYERMAAQKLEDEAAAKDAFAKQEAKQEKLAYINKSIDEHTDILAHLLVDKAELTGEDQEIYIVS